MRKTKYYIIRLGRFCPTDSTLTIEDDRGIQFEALIESLDWKILSIISSRSFPLIIHQTGGILFNIVETIWNNLKGK